jgi:hypothetical protein
MNPSLPERVVDEAMERDSEGIFLLNYFYSQFCGKSTPPFPMAGIQPWGLPLTFSLCPLPPKTVFAWWSLCPHGT